MAGLRELGIEAGAGLIVHSSLRSFGAVRGGARTVVDALMEVLTPAGTLLMPSFNHGRAFLPDGPGIYDSLRTPTSNGAIPDLFWRMQGVWRSLNPTHSFAAWGKEARRYIEGHHRTLTAGPESPIGLLWSDGGYGLLLGVGHESNTFHHVAEMAVGTPCLGPRTEAYPVRLPGGRIVEGRTWGWRAESCPLTYRGKRYRQEMATHGLERRTQIGSSQAILFRLQDCYEVVVELLAEGKDGFPPCSRCPIRPRRVERTVPSDWDAARQRLRPDSAAWDY